AVGRGPTGRRKRLAGRSVERDREQLLELRDRRRRLAVKQAHHPDGLGALDVLPQVVDEDGLAGLDRQALAGELEDRGVRLVEMDLRRDDHVIEQLAEELAVVVARAPG